LSKSYRIHENTVWTRHTVLVLNWAVRIRVDGTSKLSKEDLAPYTY
jgi:hypothetical protein